MSRIHELYTERAMEGPFDLETFVEELIRNRPGALTASELTEFLDQIEDEMLRNVQIKAFELPFYQANQEEAENRVREQIEALRERVRRAISEGKLPA